MTCAIQVERQRDDCQPWRFGATSAAHQRLDAEDVRMDVLIEGEPAMERADVKLLRELAEKAPSKQVAKLVRQIAADLRA